LKGKPGIPDLITLEDPASAPKTGATLFILAGKGAGQYRRLTGCEGRVLEIEHPLDVEPDSSSIVSIGRFNGRHIIVGNEFEDTGQIQLYPPNYSCVVAENHVRRCGDFISWGDCVNAKSYGGMSAQVSWCNQFLDNVVEEGNGWGGNIPGTQGIQDGESVMNIYAESGESDYPLPASRCQVVRRHICENNSSIRIDGSVEGALVENCHIKNNHCGIVVKNLTARSGNINCPEQILLRNNRFESVDTAYSGDALDKAEIVDIPK